MSKYSVCKGCTPETGRSADPNCHMTCEKYLAECAESNRIKEIVREAKRGTFLASRVKSDAIAKHRKRTGKK